MSIKVTSLPDAERRPRHVAIGTFDGVHVGHRQVIDRADTVLTFEPHPLSVLHPDAAPKLIMPFEIKRDVIEGLGVEELVVIPFDDEFSTIPAEEFCGRILVETLGRRAGLRGGELPLRRQGEGRPARCSPRARSSRREWCRWSRSTARSSPRAGSARWSPRARSRSRNRCLGAPFLLEGPVVEGDGRGRTLGFPTANLVPAGRSGRPRARRVCGVRQRPARGRERRRPADLRDRARAC